jgi:LacI family transcriptional regulator
MRRPSLKDVAERAGVSFQTTSKVLRGGGTVADRTRRRILAAAEDLGYVPNDVARSLVTRRTHTIGVVVGDLSDHVIARFVVGAEQEARRQDHALAIVSVEPGTDEGELSLRSLLERRVDGIITAAPQLESDTWLGDLLRTQVPAVSIHSIAGGGVSLVGSDHRATARLATDHMIALGHHRIGMVAGPRSRRVSRSRARGYADALAGAGLPPDQTIVAEGDWQPGGGYDAASAILSRVDDVTAIYVHNDLMAVGVLHAAWDRGLRVPDDLAVIGCDDIPTAAHTVPPLTTVHLPFIETGAAAVRLLLEQLASPPDAPRRELLPASLICRASCGCAGRDAGRTAGAGASVRDGGAAGAGGTGRDGGAVGSGRDDQRDR